jgi:hypothetical protein
VRIRSDLERPMETRHAGACASLARPLALIRLWLDAHRGATGSPAATG